MLELLMTFILICVFVALAPFLLFLLAAILTAGSNNSPKNNKERKRL